MTDPKNGFLLKDLQERLPESQRALIEQVLDPSGVVQSVRIRGGRSLELAAEDEMTFCKNESEGLLAALAKTRSRFVVARPSLVALLPRGFAKQRVLILTPKPRLVLASLLMPFDTPSAVAQQAMPVHPDANIAKDVVVGPGAKVGADVAIAAGCVIGANTVIDHATIGEGTRLGANCSIGGDGFGYEIDEESGGVLKVPHLGRVRIGRRVEIFANTCVARGSLKDTVIEDDVKIDNLVHVAHNCHIGQGAFVIAQAMLGGSVTIGEFGWVAPGAVLMNGVSIGRCALVGLGAVVTKSVGDNEVVLGVPAKKVRDRFPAGHPLLKAASRKP
jgi:UDP-3-O-[3-hydroxymyristoyl] glucosamine N-acyltransferase